MIREDFVELCWCIIMHAWNSFGL